MGIESFGKNLRRAAAAAALVAAPEAAAEAPRLAPEAAATHTAERSPEAFFSPEQGIAYQEGMLRMRDIARTSPSEVFRVFLAFPNGRSEWRDIPMSQMNMGNQSEGGILAIPDQRALHDAYDDAMREGGIAVSSHTHPVSEVTLAEDPSRSIPEASRIPPSFFDVSQAVLETRRSGTTGELRFAAVAPEGTWEYSLSGAEREKLYAALDAVRPAIAALERHRDGQRAYASYMEQMMRRGGFDGANDMVRSLRNGTHGDEMLNNPSAILRFGSGYEMMRYAEGVPQSALEYLQALEEISRTFQGELTRQGLDIATINAVPQTGHIEDYQNAWSRYGLTMRFSPF